MENIAARSLRILTKRDFQSRNLSYKGEGHPFLGGETNTKVIILCQETSTVMTDVIPVVFLADVGIMRLRIGKQ